MLYNFDLAVVPILVGPLQALLALLPAILVGLGSLAAAALKPRTVLVLLRLVWRQKFVIVPVAAAIVLAFIYVPALLPGPAQFEAGLGDADSWSAFRGGPERRAWMPGAPDPTIDALNWSLTQPHSTYYSSPAVVGDYLFVVTAQVSLFSITGSGRIMCIDARTGERIWTDTISDMRATFSSPAVDGEYLVVGEGLHFTKDARVVCLDSRTGETRWMYRTNCHVESSPVIADGRVYVGAGSDGIYCFALEPDENGQAQLLWHKPGDEYVDCESSPVVYDGRMYMGLGFHGNAIVCLDAVTGDEIWRKSTPYPVFSSPTIHEGRLYAGMGNADFVNDAEPVWEAEQRRLQTEEGYTQEQIEAVAHKWQPGGAVWCIDLQTGEKVWSYEVPRAVLGSVVANDQHAFFGGRDGFIYRLDKHTGSPDGRWNAGAPLLASPSLAEEHVYFVSNAGVLFGLRQDTLEPVFQSVLWTRPPAANEYFLSSPAVAHGRVYVGTPSDGLLSIGQPGEPPAARWAARRAGPGSTGVSGTAVIPQRMQPAASYPGQTTADTATLAVSAPVAVGDGVIYLPYTMNGEGSKNSGIKALSMTGENSDTLELLWTFQLPQNSDSAPLPGSPVLGDGRVYFIASGQLHAMKAEDGALLWSMPVDTDEISSLVLADKILLLKASPQGLTALNLAGDEPPAVAWRLTDVSVKDIPHAASQRVAIATADGFMLLDLVSGIQLWSVSLDTHTVGGPVIAGRRAFIGTKQGVAALDMLDGSLLWSSQLDEISEPLIVTGERVLAHDAAGSVHVICAQTGEPQGEFSPITLAPVVSRDDIYYLGSRGFSRGELKNPAARPQVWMRWTPARDGQIIHPPIVVNGSLIITTENGITLATGADLE